MTPEQWDFINVLIIVARFIQVLGFLFAVLMLVKEFPLGYTFGVFAVNLVGFFGVLVGVLTKFLSLIGVLLVDALIIAVSLVLFIKAYRIKKFKERFPPPPKTNTRCPVCGAYIKPQDSYCVLMDSKSLLYFDNKEHMKAFIENPSAYKLSKEINYDGVRRICVNKKEGWIEFKGGQSPQEGITL